MTLAKQIEADLAGRIRQGGPLPCPLRLEPLARHYGVSTRPVRQALEQLRERNLLQPRRLASLPIAADPPAVTSEQDAGPFRQLTRRLIEQSVTLGEEERFIRESPIAREMGVSTTIVREWFSRLVGHGLLEHVPRRGWRLRALRQKDLDDFIHVRQSLETLALQLAWDRLDLSIIKRHLDANRLPVSGRPVRSDNQFHSHIIQQADNRYISDFFDRHGRYFQLVFQWEDQPATTRQTIRQHRAILQAILQRDLPKAIQALGVHIRDNHPLLARVLSRRPMAQRKSPRATKREG